MLFEIKHRYSGKVIFSSEIGSLKLCVEAAVRSKVNLSDADLNDADLRYADLRGADKEKSIENLDKVRGIILDNNQRLDMGNWHDSDGWKNRTCAEETLCETTHCLAGWLQVCSTDKKIRDLDPQTAGILSAPVAAKMFFKEPEKVLEWLEKRSYVLELEEIEKRRAEKEAEQNK